MAVAKENILLLTWLVSGLLVNYVYAWSFNFIQCMFVTHYTNKLAKQYKIMHYFISNTFEVYCFDTGKPAI